jgi:hypothetical protein
MSDTEEHFKILTTTNNYYMSILRRYDFRDNKLTSITIDLGGTKRGCIQISISPIIDDTRYSNTDYSVANINFIEFSTKCNITEDFQRKIGTKHIIRTAIHLIVKQFNKNKTNTGEPEIKKFSLTDASAIDCSPNGHKISLSCLSIALYGKTWYEKYFGAIIDDIDDRKKYEEDLLKLVSPNKISWIEFSRKYNIRDEFHSMYEKSPSYRIFFTNLYNTMNRIDFCESLVNWLEFFIKTTIFRKDYLSLKWIIDPKDITPINFIDGKYIQKIKDRPPYETMMGGSKFLDSSSKLISIM